MLRNIVTMVSMGIRSTKNRGAIHGGWESKRVEGEMQRKGRGLYSVFS